MTELAPALRQESNGTVCERVVAAVAAQKGIDPLDIRHPLYDVIDTDALDAVFQSRRTEGKVTFTYLGYEVAVHSDGEIDVTPFDK